MWPTVTKDLEERFESQVSMLGVLVGGLAFGDCEKLKVSPIKSPERSRMRPDRQGSCPYLS